MGVVPLPTSLDSARRWVRDVETGPSGGRRLASATVSRGGLRVAKKGKIMLDTGSVEVTSGDLVLKESSLPAEAFREHIMPSLYVSPSRPKNGLKGGNDTEKWTEWGLFTIPVPPWASNAILIAYVQFKFTCADDYYSNNLFIHGALRIANQKSSPIPTAASSFDWRSFSGEGYFFLTLPVSGISSIPVRACYGANDTTLVNAESPNCSCFTMWSR